ncbi:MAG: DNA repair protein RadA, partial [Alphaproteobacteria bacterium HGW-Alphaproteobacteria-15]
AADLAVAAALISALADRPLPDKAAWFGEVSLAGEIRPVAHAPLRLREAAKLGFARCYGPAGAANGAPDAEFRGLGQLANLVDQVMGNA